MLSKLIVSSYGVLLEVSIWLILAGSFIVGWSTKGFGTAIMALFIAFVFCIVFFGAFLTLLDIRQSVRKIEEKQESRTKEIAQDRVPSTATMSASSNSPASMPSRDDSAPSDEQQMEPYGITFDGERYTYGEYKYGNLSDAVNYAKRQNKRTV